MSNAASTTRILAAVLAASLPMGTWAEAENFDHVTAGGMPAGWTTGATGGGSPRWEVVRDPTAPSRQHVLQQSGSGTFPWAVKQAVSLLDGFVEARVKPVWGLQDQAGGVVWRWRDSGTYYVARVNANEDNVSLYYVSGGVRNAIRHVDAPVPRNVWHRIRVEFRGNRIRVLLNGKLAIEADDSHLQEPGAVGVWTKADSVTSFDDFLYGSSEAK